MAFVGLVSHRERKFSLRPDLEILETESLDGRPAVLVHDPMTGGFDRVEWPESDLVEALRRPATMDEIHQRFTAINPLEPALRDVADYVESLGKRGWIQGSLFWPRSFAEPSRPGVFAQLARILFIQIPLLRPEHFLKATTGLARLVMNSLAYFLFFLCGIAGLFLALPRWEDYWRDSLGSFGLAGLPAFLVALIAVKTAHEFAHAYAATLAGARVSAMGIAFFFFMPLPYTDVTDAWRLAWPKRLRVAVAGMAAETALAGVALLLWALSPPGDVAVALARLSSVAVLSTLLTNLNPGPRFDGYYVLVCLFRMENLRQRGVNELRRIAYRLFLGVTLPDEEAGIGFRRRFALIVYAAYAVFYRFTLGFALAMLAYYLFPKVIGLPLAAAELWLFWGLPIAVEAKRIMGIMNRTRATLPAFLLLVLMGGLGYWFVGEWPRRLTFPAVTRSSAEEAVRTQRSGIADSVSASRGNPVAPGQVLAVLTSPGDPPMIRRAEWALREAELSEEQSWRDEVGRRNAATRGAELERRRVELAAFRQRLEYLEVKAPVAGVLAAWDSAVEPGVSLSGGKLLGWITAGPVTLLSCYPDMETAGKLEMGTDARFFPDDGSGPVNGTVVRIDSSRPEVLEDPQLAAVLGAVGSGDAYTLPKPYAKVVIELERPMPRNGQTGVVWVWSKPESLALRTLEWLRSLAVRESAF